MFLRGYLLFAICYLLLVTVSYLDTNPYLKLLDNCNEEISWYQRGSRYSAAQIGFSVASAVKTKAPVKIE